MKLNLTEEQKMILSLRDGTESLRHVYKYVFEFYGDVSVVAAAVELLERGECLGVSCWLHSLNDVAGQSEGSAILEKIALIVTRYQVENLGRI